MTENWYPVTSDHPPQIVQVKAETSCAIIIASRVWKSGKDIWAEWVKGKPRPLNEVPSLWSPQWPDRWAAPLPHPVVSSMDGRMWSEGMTFSSVDHAEAAELAREMETDRKHARNQPSHPNEDRQMVAWWRDATQIRYEPKGQVSLKMAEGRVMRAVRCCGGGAKHRGLKSALAGMVAEAIGTGDPDGQYDYVPRFQPLPQDGDDWITAMSWFAALNPPEFRLTATDALNDKQQLLIDRAKDVPPSFSLLAGEMRISAQGAWERYKSIIEKVQIVANGGTIHRGLSDQLAELRDRNVAFKRRETA